MPDFLPTVWGRDAQRLASLKPGIAFVRARIASQPRAHPSSGRASAKFQMYTDFLSLEASLQAGVLSFTVDGLSPESVAEEMLPVWRCARATVRRLEFVMPILEGAWRYVLTLRISDYLDIALMAYAIYWLLKLVGVEGRERRQR